MLHTSGRLFTLKKKLTEQVVVGVSLILEGESAVTDMIQIFQPLKVRNCHTPSVQIHVLTEETRRMGVEEREGGNKERR